MTPDTLAELARELAQRLAGNERLIVNVGGEVSDFVRLNHARVRQAGQVTQHYLTLELVAGRRHLSATVTLSGDLAADRALARDMLRELRMRVDRVPDDPYLHLPDAPAHSEHRAVNDLPEAGQAIADLLRAADGLDLVGIYAAGEIVRGMADSLGSLHWHATHSFNLDWSCYGQDGRAIKNCYAGGAWSPQALREKLTDDRATLARLDLPRVELGPGRYRCYLAPAALQELIDMLGWGDLGCRSQRTRQSALLQLVERKRCLSHLVTLREDRRCGFAPGFTEQGFVTVAPVTLIERGEYAGALVNARSAREYGLTVNSPSESPVALDLAPGALPAAEVPAALDTGIYISNLWYCNYSDRNHGRITGMTRFATLWVERGRMRGPVSAMRFDDTLYHMLGDRLEALTVERERRMDPGTYGGRSCASALLPGALVNGLEITL